MSDLAFEPTSVLDSMAAAFARGDGPSGEQLLERALDLGVPWDQVTGTAARAIVGHLGQRATLVARTPEA